MAVRLVPPSETLTAPGLLLRRWRSGDVRAMVRAVQASMPELSRWMPWAVEGYGAAEARAFLDEGRQQWDEGRAFNYAIVLGGRDVVGGISLMARVGPGALEIGYWVDSRHTGRGVARRAAAALTAAGLAVPGIDLIEIHHEPANGASGAVPRSLGFERSDDIVNEDGRPTSVWQLHAARLADSRIPDLLDQRRYR
jgi:RimJ/RimL family protein N-acetyltransferase